MSFTIRTDDDTDERATELVIFFAVCWGAAWVTVLLRAYVRYFLINNVAADDWWMLAAIIAYSGYSVNNIYGTAAGGTGRHVKDLTRPQIYIGLKTWYISEVLYAPVSAMVRTSVALFLLRLCVHPMHKRIIVAILVVVWTTGAAFMAVVAFQCDPPSYFYDQVLGLKGHCVDIQVVPNVTIAHSVIGAACDFVYAILPIAMLWEVRLNKRTKASVALLLGMGLISGIALLVRIPYVKVLAISPDFLYQTVDVAIWSVSEPSLGIIAGSLGTLRPLLAGFGFGNSRTTQRTPTYVNKYPRRKTAPTTDRDSTIELQSSAHSTQDRALLSTLEEGRAPRPESRGSDCEETYLNMVPLDIPRATLSTNIMGRRSSWASQRTAEPSPRGISVMTSIFTEIEYEAHQPGSPRLSPGRGRVPRTLTR